MHAYVIWVGSILLWPIAPGGVCDIFVPVPAFLAIAVYGTAAGPSAGSTRSCIQ